MRIPTGLRDSSLTAVQASCFLQCTSCATGPGIPGGLSIHHLMQFYAHAVLGGGETVVSSILPSKTLKLRGAQLPAEVVQRTELEFQPVFREVSTALGPKCRVVGPLLQYLARIQAPHCLKHPNPRHPGGGSLPLSARGGHFIWEDPLSA